MSNSVLSIRGLTAGYGGRSVIQELDLDIAPGERIAIIGPNGSGKSTLFRAITNELDLRGGTITLMGARTENWRSDSIIRTGVGYLKQDRNVFPGLSVLENLELAAAAPSVGSPRLPHSMLEAFSTLAANRHTRAGTMSAGERQLLAVAMALMRVRSLLLLDEPIAGISEAAAKRLLGAIDAGQQRYGFSVAYIEHRLKLIQPYVSRCLVMQDGRIVCDTPDTSILTDRVRLEAFYQL